MKPSAVIFWVQVVLVLMVAGAGWVLPAAADLGGRVERSVGEAVTLRQQTQAAEEQWREERRSLVAELDALEQAQAQLREQTALLSEAVAAARTRVASKEKQLADIEALSTRIRPFLEDQVDRLAALIATDAPFLPEERRRRLEGLRVMMEDPDTAISEKLRKTMEAWFVEAEYGDTIEVYQQTIALNGNGVLVDIFRLGRLGLFYQTLDGRQCGVYDVAAKAWQPLPDRHNRAIQAALAIGARQKPVELLTLPLGRMVAE
ncbi:DUF3450 domain-containing protein [Desulfatitalea alkaliphila]|uniref:DUF3450 domain-containing protein n=1 Tax=Desulfatitalea alkaliphila TaxID=2929485 RepID=A0AA41UI75_9BACT|nr:DUF3450 domain-containing protein [Desulfatitalea alkaliphila]MCJ8499332.1 DUF3450 domain-containing protein [Desulfatitalea alkaliphila]